MREKLRLAILEAYGIDIDKYKFEFQTSLEAYTINLGEFTIRVTTGSDVPMNMRLARLKWASELKAFKNTICEPVPSKKGNLLEEVKIGNWNLTLSKHRTAKGELINPSYIRPMVFISAGDMLGSMHSYSEEHQNDQENYDIPTPEVIYEQKKKKVENLLSPDVRMRIDDIIGDSAKIKKTKENYGVCYGEYDLHNVIVDTNNIHLFDFDGTMYAHYLYDVASFLVSLLSSGYMPGRKAKDIAFNIFIPWFRVGYSINKHCEENTFDDIHVFMGLRGVWILINLLEKYQREEIPEIKQQIDFVSKILLGKDIYEGIDMARSILFRK